MLPKYVTHREEESSVGTTEPKVLFLYLLNSQIKSVMSSFTLKFYTVNTEIFSYTMTFQAGFFFGFWALEKTVALSKATTGGLGSILNLPDKKSIK